MALFSKKSDDQKDDQKKETSALDAVSSDTSKSDKVPELKIPAVLLQPRISEKAGKLVSLNKYVFAVLKSANKVEVKKAVEKHYKVRVVQVNMVNTQGKLKNFGRIAGKTSGFKKAIVTLKKGDTIKGLTDVV